MFNRILKKWRILSILAVSLASAALFGAHTSYAATLSLYPVASSVSVGNIISVAVDVNANDAYINTAGATVHFPTDLLQVMSVSKSSSIFSLWVEDPTFSNTDGTVNFMGGLPTPGFGGQNGQIVSIVFRARKPGTATLVLSDGSVLANDGNGTDVMTAEGSAIISINSSSAETPAAGSGGKLASLPVITSATEPNQNAWYPNTTASFAWIVPSDVTSIQTLLSKEADSVPTVTYDSSVSERTVDNLPDGIFYFHLRYMNAAGWGPIAAYKVQLDSTPPENFALNVQTKGVQNVVTLNAIDAMSGIDSYSVAIDNEPVVRVQNDSLVAGQYVLPTQSEGQHSLAVVAYDKAGNHTESDTTFGSPAIIAPTVAVYPVGSSCTANDTNCPDTSVMRGDAAAVKGESQYPNTTVIVFVQPQGKQAQTYAATTSADGSYALVTNPIDTAGQATVWSELVFSDGVKSALSNRAVIRVNDTFVVQTSKSAIYGLSFALPALLLILALIFLGYEGWHKFFGLKKRLEKEAQETVNDVHKSLDMFKDELENQLAKLEDVKNDRELSKKEEKIFRDLRARIDDIDDFIEKKIKKMR